MSLRYPHPFPPPSSHFTGARIPRAAHLGDSDVLDAPRWGDEQAPLTSTGETALQTAARMARQAGNALDAFGHACITLRARDGRMLWQTPLARDLLAKWYPDDVARRPLHAPQPVIDWLKRHLADALRQLEPPHLSLARETGRLTFRLHRRTGDDDEDDAGEGEWLIVMREESDSLAIEAISVSLGLTAREAEVLYWVAKGKINRDIAEIVGASPATVKKHLERVFAKLGVETRTSAAAMAMDRLGQWVPHAGG